MRIHLELLAVIVWKPVVNFNSPEDAVVLWLGRRSLPMKADPWPAYRVLQRVARRFSRPLWLIELVPMTP